MAENKFLSVFYTIFLGVLITVFIGVGISTFYLEPTYPETSATDSALYGKSEPLTDADKSRLEAIDAANVQYAKDQKTYSQNVSIILLVFAVVLVTVSILIETKSKIFSDGIMLGGLFTLVYSIIRGAIADNKMYLFIATTIGLCVVAYLGYHRFVRRSAEIGKPKVKLS